jgi:hypothetical protein
VLVLAMRQDKVSAAMSDDVNPFEEFRFEGVRSTSGAQLQRRVPPSLSVVKHPLAKTQARASTRNSPGFGKSKEDTCSNGGSAAGSAACGEKRREEAEDSPGKKRKRTGAAKAASCQPPALPKFDGWLPIYERGHEHNEILPVVAGTPRGWRERWAGVCEECFQVCFHSSRCSSMFLNAAGTPSDRPKTRTST